MTGSTAPAVAPRSSVASPLPSPAAEPEGQEVFPHAPSPRKRLMSPPPRTLTPAEDGAAAGPSAEDAASPSIEDDAAVSPEQDTAELAEDDSTHPSVDHSISHSVDDPAKPSEGDETTAPVDDAINHSVDDPAEPSEGDETTVPVDDLVNHTVEDSSVPSAKESASPSKADEVATPLPDDPSRVMSPEVGALPHGLPHHHHQRTQSMDSTSSGHSSGSGSGSGSSAFNNAGRRRVTVKPLAEPEDQDTAAFIRPTNETPIEKEIRLAREREAELAREKALRLGITSPTAADQSIINNNTVVKTLANNNNNNVEVVENKESVRNATNRIQQEISRANEREQELRHSKEGPQRFSTPEFPGRVKLKKAVSTSQLAVLASEQTPVARPPLRRLGSTTPQPQPQPQPQGVVSSAPTSRAPLGRSVSAMAPAGSPTLASLSLVTPRRYAPHPSQKGVMQRFLASRGKVNPVGLVSNGVSPGTGSVSLPPVLPLSPLSPMSPSAPMSPVQVPLSPASTAKMSAMVDTHREMDREEPAPAPMRRGYTSAEDKIQEELKEMRRREEELRLQRARTFARSQPNLLSLLDDVDGPDSTTLKESSPVIDKLPAMAALRSALSNPNLLDEDSHHNGVDSLNEKKNLGTRKKNALIAEWENRIQQLNEH